jgi:hypothetical protein
LLQAYAIIAMAKALLGSRAKFAAAAMAGSGKPIMSEAMIANIAAALAKPVYCSQADTSLTLSLA